MDQEAKFDLKTPHEMLYHLLETRRLSREWLEIIIKKFEQEGDHHDFKDIRLLDDPRGARKLREAVSSFANSAGGVLFVGVTEGERDREGKWIKRREICTIRPNNSATPESWATSALQPQAPAYSPAPHSFSVENGDCPVLVIVVDCGFDYVRVVGAIWLRFGDVSKPAPDHLLADLLLGRRARPNLMVEPMKAQGTKKPWPAVVAPWMISEGVSFRIEPMVVNQGLAWAEDVRVGLVSHTLGWAGPQFTTELDRIVEIQAPSIAAPGLNCVLTKHALRVGLGTGLRNDLDPFSGPVALSTIKAVALRSVGSSIRRKLESNDECTVPALSRQLALRN
jgi:hypothetical protein